MGEAIYDDHARFYVEFVDRVTKTKAYEVSLAALLKALGEIKGKDVCDLACGEGFLSRIMSGMGARVRGYDLSKALIEVARTRSNNEIEFDVSDAQQLEGVEDESFDIVVSHLAAMDIPDIDSMFATARRVLRPSGKFALVLLHPCFETPFSGEESISERDTAGNFVACRVMHYRQEGLWHSGGIGVRGKVGAYHRKLSTYLNALISNGFELIEFLEPMLPDEDYSDFSDRWSKQIPRRLGVIAEARG